MCYNAMFMHLIAANCNKMKTATMLDLITEFSIMQSKGVGKFCSKQFGCNKWLDLLAVDVLNGFYCIVQGSPV